MKNKSTKLIVALICLCLVSIEAFASPINSPKLSHGWAWSIALFILGIIILFLFAVIEHNRSEKKHGHQHDSKIKRPDLDIEKLHYHNIEKEQNGYFKFVLINIADQKMNEKILLRIGTVDISVIKDGKKCYTLQSRGGQEHSDIMRLFREEISEFNTEHIEYEVIDGGVIAINDAHDEFNINDESRSYPSAELGRSQTRDFIKTIFPGCTITENDLLYI